MSIIIILGRGVALVGAVSCLHTEVIFNWKNSWGGLFAMYGTTCCVCYLEVVCFLEGPLWEVSFSMGCKLAEKTSSIV